MEDLPPEIVRLIVKELSWPTDRRPLAYTCHQLYLKVLPLLHERIVVTTLNLRPIVSKVLDDPILARQIRDVTFTWEEYRGPSTLSRFYSDRERRIPLSGEIPPPTTFVNSCHRFLEESGSGFRWTRRWAKRLVSGSADAEACLLLLALPNLQTLRLKVKDLDWDDLNDVVHLRRTRNPEYYGHVFRHEMLLSMIRDTKPPATTVRHPLRSLENLVISKLHNDRLGNCTSHVGLNNIQGVFGLPNLRSLELCQIGTTGLTSPLIPLRIVPGSTPLESLTITNASLSADDLEAILASPKRLKRFHYHVTWPDELFTRQNKSFWRTRTLTPKMTSPKLFLASLDRHKDTLEYLHISSINSCKSWETSAPRAFEDIHNTIMPLFDLVNNETVAEHGERRCRTLQDVKNSFIQPVDLSDFKELRIVSVHATDLLGAMNKQDAMDFIPLSTVLPPTLQVLGLRYSNFFSDWDPQLVDIYERNIGDNGNHPPPWKLDVWSKPDEHKEWYDAYFEHLKELLFHKAERFPKLTRVELSLDMRWPKPNERFIELAEAVGVQLAVKLEEEYGFRGQRSRYSLDS